MRGVVAAARMVVANSRPENPGKLNRVSIEGIPVIGHTPEQKGVSCPIVVLHGVTPEGELDPRMIRFLGGLAAAGVEAYAPRLEGMASGVLKEGDVLDISRVVGALSRKHGSRVGLMGFSVGGGYGLLAAGRSETRDKVAFVCSVGGYARLREMVQGFFETFGDDREDEGWARIVCFHSFSSRERLSPDDREIIVRMTRLPCGISRTRELTAMGNELDSEGRRYFEALVARESWVRDVVLEDLDRTNADGEMSPVDRVDMLSCPVFLLHGLHDPTISWKQTAALNSALLKEDKLSLRYRVSGSFGHVRPGKVYKIVSQVKDLLFFGAFLGLALKERQS